MPTMNTRLTHAGREPAGAVPRRAAGLRSRRLGAACGVLAGSLTATLGSAAEWTFVPVVEVNALYTDNVTLAPSGAESDDFVGVLSPGFELAGESERLSVGLDYTLQAVGFAQTDGANRAFQIIDSELNAELLQDHVFVNLSGDLFQQVSDPTNPFIQNNITRTANRTDTVDTRAQIIWREQVGQAAETEVSYSYGRLDFEDEGLFDAELDRAQAVIASPASRGSGFTWALRANLDRVEYGRGIPEAEFSTIVAELGVFLSDSVRTFVTGGVESDWLTHRDRIEYDTGIWSVGVDWRVGDRDQLTASYGERVFGSNFNFNWVHRFRERVSVNVGYTETPSTNALGARLLRGGQLDFTGQTGLDSPANINAFVLRRFSGGINLSGNRLQVGLLGFTERRDDQVGGDGVLLPGVTGKSVGASLNATLDLGARSSLRGGARWEDAEFDNGLDVERLSFDASLRYELGSRTDVALEYQRFDGRSPALDFIENRIGIRIGRRFE